MQFHVPGFQVAHLLTHKGGPRHHQGCIQRLQTVKAGPPPLFLGPRDARCLGPLAVKLSPFFTAPANFGLRLSKAGADALVLLSRVCESDFDIEEREIITSLKVNPPDELRVRLHWTAILHGQVGADLAVAGGVRSERDIVKCIMAGARVVFTASALLQKRVGISAVSVGRIFRADAAATSLE